jgi:transposase
MLQAIKINEKQINEQELYIGLDVHHKQWTISVIGKDKEYIKGKVIVPNASALKKYIERRFTYNKIKLAYEAGFCGYWIQRALSIEGIEAIVVNAADIPTSDKDSKQKTDGRDSMKIAKSLRGGLLEPLYVPTEIEEEHQQYIRQRTTLVDKQTRVKQQIKSQLKKYGITVKGSYKWGRRLKYEIRQSVKQQRPNLLRIVEQLLSELELYEQQIKEIELEIEAMIKQSEHKDSYHRLLMIPGIGKVTAAALLFEIYNIGRFKRFEHFASYIGLIPTEHSSGDKIRRGQITRRGHPRLKKLIVESSWIIRLHDMAFTKYYKYQIGRSKKPQQAIIKCAKKLLSRIYHILLTGEEYKINYAA